MHRLPIQIDIGTWHTDANVILVKATDESQAKKISNVRADEWRAVSDR